MRQANMNIILLMLGHLRRLNKTTHAIGPTISRTNYVCTLQLNKTSNFNSLNGSKSKLVKNVQIAK